MPRNDLPPRKRLFVGRRGRISWGRGDNKINSLGLPLLKTMMCWWEAIWGDDGASLFETYWRSKCKRSMTKFKAGGKTLGEHVGDVAKTKPSREEGFAKQQSNIEPDHGKTKESSETC